MLLKIAEVLQCNYKAFDNYSLGVAEDIIETLFWLEGNLSFSVNGEEVKIFSEYTAPGNLIRLSEMSPETKEANVRMTFNNYKYGAPVALTFEYGLVNDFLLR